MVIFSQDARYYQIITLFVLLSYGVLYLQFYVPIVIIVAYVFSCLLVQYLASRLVQTSYDPKSALISSLSLCLLLRTQMIEVAVVVSVITVASKFVIRVGGKHVFNPTNFGIVVMLLATDIFLPVEYGVWVSNGQWGSEVWFMFLMVCLGGVVLYRVERSDIALAFLTSYGLLFMGRALWLGDPLVIPFHHLQNGGILLFAFFMLSDPKTIPNTRVGRIMFAILVAVVAWYLQTVLYVTDGLFYSLALSAVIIPVLDHYYKGKQCQWVYGK